MRQGLSSPFYRYFMAYIGDCQMIALYKLFEPRAYSGVRALFLLLYAVKSNNARFGNAPESDAASDLKSPPR